ncbi:rhomboid-related protein 4-like [Anolis carolinensis]|uniref:rhomboid-related protein 4-like n=1 Tax=Anolis carolinensis TaxID=28377 RepID=UPI002F2B4675
MAPWATLGLGALNVALFLRPLRPPSGACLSLKAVWEDGQWERLLLAPVHHLGCSHLALNMAALFWLGRRLEKEAGSLWAGVALVGLALLGGLLHLALNAVLAALFGQRWYWEHCALGLSGLLFSLEAMGQLGESVPVAAMSSGFVLPTRWLCLLECLALAVVHPRSSLTGHFSGILAGLAFSFLWGLT